jgi:cellulose synthase/poly-beta-1,6-N-acetylglucosamine synthase-like glycosyltransferase
MDNIFSNYERQSHQPKEMILILNNCDTDIEKWKEAAIKYPNVKIFKLEGKITIGSSMNFAVEQTQYEFIANFDHDDYYGPLYLTDFINAANRIDAGLFGKRTHFTYIQAESLLALRHLNMEYRYVDFVDGPTIFFKKAIFEKVKYIDSDFADCQLSFDCQRNGIKIYSVNKENFCYIRSSNENTHTWKIDDTEFLERFCTKLGKVGDFRSYVNLR